MSQNNPLIVVMPPMGGLPWCPADQAEHGRIIGMMDQLARTVERENEQARYANGLIVTWTTNQYF